MRSRIAPWVSFVLAAFLGFIVAAPGSFASRNSSGTYSLPAGNPVVTGTTISATTHNNTLSDVATEMTDSLSRSGKGNMLAALHLYDGVLGTPGLNFGSDTDTGLYRVGANDAALVGGGVKALEWTASTVTLPLATTASALFTASAAISAAKTSGDAITGTATTSGVGVVGVGAGASAGVSGTGGATNGSGVSGAGTGSGAGVSGTGGASGVGGAFTGGSGGAIGLTGTGTSTSAGASFANGTAATGGTRRDAVTLTNGDINLSGVANATGTTAITNRLTPSNIIKAWGNVTSTGAGGVTINGSFNIASCVISGASIRCTLATAMANTNYVVVATDGGAGGVGGDMVVQGRNISTTVIDFSVWLTGVGTNLATNIENIGFVVIGLQ